MWVINFKKMSISCQNNNTLSQTICIPLWKIKQHLHNTSSTILKNVLKTPFFIKKYISRCTWTENYCETTSISYAMVKLYVWYILFQWRRRPSTRYIARAMLRPPRTHPALQHSLTVTMETWMKTITHIIYFIHHILVIFIFIYS